MRLVTPCLSVDVAAPGTVYRGTRFDWTGFVTQVTLDGRTTFCVPEAVDGTGTGGIGLSNEFGLAEPVGFDDAQPGEWFPKLGVGLLRRPDGQPYFFARPYDLRPFPMRWEASETEAAFVVDSLPARGYAARLEKRMRVEGPRLTVSYVLQNLGERPLRTREYAHNFLMVNAGRARGYTLRLPVPLPERPWAAGLRAEGAEVRWLRPLRGAHHAAVEPWPPGARWFELRHAPTGACVREETDHDWVRLAVWGTDRVISPEVFVAIDVAPGATYRWQRTWTFERRQTSAMMRSKNVR
jgi:hypothetical protein